MNSNLPLPIQLWLKADDYDHTTDVTHISTTTLIKPIRQLILGEICPPIEEDLLKNVNRSIGTAIHSAIEKVIKDNNLPIITELRSYKKVGKYTVSGKFDFVLDNTVYDIKKTSCYNYTNKYSKEQYKLQGSIYKWLNQELITEPYMYVVYIFTDWSSSKSKQEGYPKNSIEVVPIELYSIEFIERYVSDKLDLISKYRQLDQSKLPLCSKEDLWLDDSVFKYYANPDKLERSTKNFTNSYDAMSFLGAKGKGTVVEVKGTPKKCSHCKVSTICTQKELYDTSSSNDRVS